MKHRNTQRIGIMTALLFLMLPICAALICIGIGRVSIPANEICLFFYGKLTGQSLVSSITEMTLFHIRLPRILLACLAGAGLSLAGCAFQSLFSNPLATPDTLGVASGASFGAALGILIGFELIGIQMTAFFMGIIAVAMTYLAGSGRGRNISSVVLAGIMIGSLFSALVSFVKFAADTESQLPAITYWLMGSLASAGYENLIYGFPPILIGIIILFLIRWRMNLLPLTEDEVRSSGINIRNLRIIVIICATMMTSSCVAMCGQVGWIGLLIPHMCRMMYGNNHMILVPASISFGGAFMIIVDTFARSVSAAEIPISILTAIIGAPFFIFLMRTSRGWRL